MSFGVLRVIKAMTALSLHVFAISLCILSVSAFHHASVFAPRVIHQRSVSSSLFLGGKRLRLFSVRSKNQDLPRIDDADKSSEEGGGEDQLEFMNWAKSLRRWPLYPTAKPSAEAEEKISSLSGRDSQNVPLANLINVEALLMASGEETLDNAKDIEMFEFGTYDLAEEKTTTKKEGKLASTPLSVLSSLEELGNWDKLVGTLQRSVSELTVSDPILKEATARIENVVNLAVSPAKVQDLIVRASKTLALEESANNIVKIAEKLARQRGLDVSEAADRARETTKYTTSLVKLANGLLVSGYVTGDSRDASRSLAGNSEIEKPLFHKYNSVSGVTASQYNSTVAKGAEMGELAGGIYEDVVARSHELGHSLVANGTISDVTWMITDSLAYEDEFQEARNQYGAARKPLFVRTITIRGFDASDESVDREGLLNTICTASPEVIGEVKDYEVHSGLLSIARDIYKELEGYIDLSAPEHRVVLNGHSIGGSLSILLLLLLTEARGADFVREKVLRTFTFGSPPVAKRRIEHTEHGLATSNTMFAEKNHSMYHCDILEAFDLPESIVYGYVQPWDPIVRLFSVHDPLYPLLGDLGADGKTLYVSGPARSLRPITRAIIESWEGWPRFRDNFRNTVNQNYTSVGIQHLLLPDRVRYLSDRFVSVSVAVPPVESVVRISSKELLPALKETFPLDVFQISFVPTAIRSFVHHFFPAYGAPFFTEARSTTSEQTYI